MVLSASQTEVHSVKPGQISLSASSERGGVSAPHALAAEAGAAILRSGGNAIEAGIAVASTLSVVYPHMNGLGGDGFWLISDGDAHTVRGLAAAGPSGRRYSAALFHERGLREIPFRGGLSALTVPGAVGGWGAAFGFSRDRWWGRKSWSDLLESAYCHAATGFPLSPNQSHTLARFGDALRQQPGFAAHYMPGGEIMPTGRLWSQRALAQTLGTLAENGAEAFYQGPLAWQMAKGLKAAGSLLTEADLQAFEPRWVEPVRTAFGVGEAINMPPPTQGVASLMILALLNRVGLNSGDHLGSELIHNTVEITKLAFKYRDQLIADPDFCDVDIASLLNPDFLDDCAREIHPHIAMPLPPIGPAKGDTVWFGVVDGQGRMVSVIQSLYHEFGTGVVAGNTGVLWNNRGCAFSLEPGHVNVLVPGKRPFHTLNPALYAEQGRVQLAYGSMGGDGQPQTQAALLMRVKHYGLSLAESVASPRWLYGRTWGETSAGLRLEQRYSRTIFEDLQRWGHKVSWVPRYSDFMGHAGMVARDLEGGFAGAADPRSDGGVAVP
nr:gamma-glutamyltransferase [Acidithiobacillus ferrooxidans]